MSENDHDIEYVVVPPERLEADILTALIEDFILHEGANHGAEATAMDTKVEQVRKQLTNGSAVIVFHLVEEVCRIIPAHQLRSK